MAQQTAVEWLRNVIYDEWGISIPDEAIEQAKAMEKEHIISAWLCGENDGSLEPKAFVELAEQYYNETYVSKITITETNRSIEGIGLNK